MHKDIRDKIKQVTESSAIEKPDFLELLHLIDQHYDKMEATITQSIQTRTFQDSTPIEAIFDSVTEALMSVSANGVIRNCNKVCPRYFDLEKGELINAFTLSGTYGLTIGIGAWLGSIMLFNVWILIWPNQKKVLGIVEASADEIAKAKSTALMASRTNTMLSIPMLMSMVGAHHGFVL